MVPSQGLHLCTSPMINSIQQPKFGFQCPGVLRKDQTPINSSHISQSLETGIIQGFRFTVHINTQEWSRTLQGEIESAFCCVCKSII